MADRATRILLVGLALVGCSSDSNAAGGGEPVEAGAPGVPDSGAPRAALTEVPDFGENPGNLRMYEYAPAGAASGAPLVLALHGCTQSAADYARAGWNDLAEKHGFFVAYPEQIAANNQNRCFNWFEPRDSARDQGEVLSIKQMVDAMVQRHEVDVSRVFVTGLSAGGAMTSVMLAAYPDVFAAGAIMAGVPYGCSTSVLDALACSSPGKDRTPAEWAGFVREAHAGYTGSYPRVSVWHGSRDGVVAVKNLTEVVDQWTGVHGLGSTASASETLGNATHESFADEGGVVRVESWLLEGMGHGVAVDPGLAEAGGCGEAGAFVLDVGVCSTLYAGRFFGVTK